MQLFTQIQKLINRAMPKFGNNVSIVNSVYHGDLVAGSTKSHDQIPANVVSQTRPISSVTKLEVYGRFDFTFTRSDTTSLTITGEEKFLDSVLTENKDGTLTIKNKTNKKSFQVATISITGPSLTFVRNTEMCGTAEILNIQEDTLSLNVSGYVTVEGTCKTLDLIHKGPASVNLDKLSFENSYIVKDGAGDMSINADNSKHIGISSYGAGEVKITGTCESMQVIHEGCGDFNSEKLISKNTTIQKEGCGEMSLHATESVAGNISGCGQIHIYGEPKSDSIETDRYSYLNYH